MAEPARFSWEREKAIFNALQVALLKLPHVTDTTELDGPDSDTPDNVLRVHINFDDIKPLVVVITIDDATKHEEK